MTRKSPSANGAGPTPGAAKPAWEEILERSYPVSEAGLVRLSSDLEEVGLKAVADRHDQCPLFVGMHKLRLEASVRPVEAIVRMQEPAAAEVPAAEGSPREQLTMHLDCLGLGEDGTEIVLDLAPVDGGGHWLRLATVKRDREATDPLVFIDVHDVLMTKKREERGQKPKGTHHGTHNWLFQATSTGSKKHKGKVFQLYFKSALFRGKGHKAGGDDVIATRAFHAEGDSACGTLQAQWARAMLLESLGLRFNALVDSGGKSLHHFVRAPKGMPVDFERDERINKKLCVAIGGDYRVVNRDRSMRLAGFERHKGRPQALLKGTTEELYATVEELEATIDRVLLELGITDWEAAFKALSSSGEGEEALRSLQRSTEWDPDESWRSGPSTPCRCCGRTKSEMCEEWVFEDPDGTVRNGITCFEGDTHAPPETWESPWGGAAGPLEAGDLVQLQDGAFAKYCGPRRNRLGGFKVFLVDAKPLPRVTEEEFWRAAPGALAVAGSAAVTVAAEVMEPERASAQSSALTTGRGLTARDRRDQFHLLIEDLLIKGPDRRGSHWVTFNGVTYKWADTHYKKVPDEAIRKDIIQVANTIVRADNNGENAYHPFLNGGEICNALSWFKLVTTEDPELVNPSGCINCRNGVAHVRLEDKKPVVTLEPHDPTKHFFLEAPGFAYKPDADRTEALRFLQIIEGEAQKRLLLQVMGSAFVIDAVRWFGHRVPALLLIGTGQNGKDTLRTLIERIFGAAAIARISLKDWQQFDAGEGRGRFSVHSIQGARLSIASENKETLKLDGLQELKKAITGDPVKVERKGQDPVDVNPKAAFLFFMNGKPLLDGGSAAILSRYGVINMPYSFSTTPMQGQLRADARFKEDPEWVAEHVLPALVNLMIEGFGDAVANGFDMSVCEDAMQELRDNTCHLHDFLRESSYEVGDPTDCVEVGEVYTELDHWYRAERWKEMNSQCQWVFIPTKDGDEPVRADRLLAKRLQALFPSVRRARHTQSRRWLLFGMRKKPGAGRPWFMPAQKG